MTAGLLFYATRTDDYPLAEGQVLAYTQPYERLLLGDGAITAADGQMGRSIAQLNTGDYKVWWAPCVIKVLPSYQVPTLNFNPDQDKALRLARNETRCFQLALTANAGGRVPAVSINASDPSITAEASLEALINISESSYTFDKDQNDVNKRYEYSQYTGLLPDPLIPWSFQPYTGDDPDGDGRSPSLDNLNTLRNSKGQMVSGQTRTLLIDVTTTKNTTAGPHILNVTIGDQSVSLPIEVFNFTLPDRPTLKTAIGTGSFNINLDVVGRPLVMHGVTTTTQMKKLMDDYYHEALASFRMAPYTPTWPVKLVESSYDFITSKSEYNCTTDTFKLRPAVEALLNKFLMPGQIGIGYLKGKPIPPMSNWQIQHLTKSIYNPNQDGTTPVAVLPICGISVTDENQTKQPGLANWEWALSRFYTAMQVYLAAGGANWRGYTQVNIDEPDISPVNRAKIPDPTGQYRDLNRPLPLAEQNVGFKNVWKISKVAIEKSGLPVGAAMARVSDFYDMTDDRLAKTDATGAQVPGQYPFNNPVFINDFNQEEAGRNWFNQAGFAPAPQTNCDPLAPDYQTRCLRQTDKPWYYHVFDPTFQGDSPAIDQIMPGWMIYKYGFGGFLYWSINWWAGEVGEGVNAKTKTFVNPWTSPKTFAYPGMASQNLSNVLWYPPCGEIKCPSPTYYVINSLRLPLMRESILDYEYMKILEEKQGRQAVLNLAKLQNDDMIRRTTVWNYNPALLLSTRYALAEAISQGSPSVTPTSPMPTLTPTATPSPTIRTSLTPTPSPTSELGKIVNGSFQGSQFTAMVNFSNNASLPPICNVPSVYPTLPSGWQQSSNNLLTKIITSSQCTIGLMATGWGRTGSNDSATRYDIIVEPNANKSHQVITDGKSVGIYQALSLTSGKRYKIEADIYVTKGQAIMRLNDSVSGQNKLSTPLSVQTQWQKATINVDDGALFTKSLLRLMSNSSNSIFYVDNVKVTVL